MADIPLEKRICEAATGEPCDSLFGIADTKFFDVAQAIGPRVGNKIIVSLSDPLSLFTDIRTVVLAFDNDPLNVVVAKQQEGTKASYDIPQDASNVHLWIDSESVTATLQIVRPQDAAAIISEQENEESALEKIAGGINEQLEKERARQNKMLIGAGIFILALAGIAAYALPRIKIPTVSVV